MVDSGSFSYEIDCGNVPHLNCRTCITNTETICQSCYSEDGFYFFNNTICTANCSDASSFEFYPNGTICAKCVNPCLNCITLDLCKSCVDGYYLYVN